MRVPMNGVLLRSFIGESDRQPEQGRPLFEAIVRRAREAQPAGATVLRGPIGFGRHSGVHTAKFMEFSTDLPFVIEIVDTEEKMEAFLPTVDALPSSAPDRRDISHLPSVANSSRRALGNRVEERGWIVEKLDLPGWPDDV
jgi:uncharacterized protein